MNNLLILVPRYLRQQQKRAALTALGIILAVALLTATGVLAASMRQTMIDQAIASTADYHGMVSGVSPEQVAALAARPEIDAAGLASALGVHQLENLFISIESFDATTREMFNLRLLEGRYPAAAGEIALERWVFDYLGLPAATGQSVTLPFRQSYRDRQGHLQSYQDTATFTVVGIIEDTGAKAAGASLGLVAPETIATLLPPEAREYRGFVRVDAAYAPQETLVQAAQSVEIPQEQIHWNEQLLQALGQGDEINWPVAALGAIVITATIATIYNAFHIAVLERMRQFGLLRALGATGRQIRLLVLGEALLLALVALPLGLLTGVGAAAAVAQMLTLFDEVVGNIVVPGGVLAGAVALGLVTVLVSALLPALLAGRVPPLEAIQGHRAVLQGQGLRRHGVVRRLGITVHMAYQNLWRNRRRSLVTVFSLGLGVVLFLSFSAWAASTDSAVLARGMISGDYSLAAQAIQSGIGFAPEVEQVLEGMPEVAQVQGFQADYGLNLLLVEDQVDPEVVAMMRDDPAVPPSEVQLPSMAIGYGALELEQSEPYLTGGQIDPRALAEAPAALLYDPRHTSSLVVGDTVTVQDVSQENGQLRTAEKDFTIVGILEDLPMVPVAYPIGPVLVMHEQQYQALTGDLLYKRFDITLAEGVDPAAVVSRLQTLASTSPHGDLLSYEEEVAELEAQKRQMMIMAYSLVAVITIIGAVNIVNTITTNLILRTREFGMLRAVGITGRQLRSLTGLEGLFYGLLGAAWSVPLGLALAYLLYQLLRQEMTYLVWTMPWQGALLAAVACVVIGVAATLLPMRRLARLQVVEALRTIV